MKISATLDCQNIIQRRLSENKDVYNFGLGANPIQQPTLFIESLQEYANHKEYVSPEGVPELQTTLKTMYSTTNYADKILIGNGLKELIFIIQSAFDGKIIHITPSWISYKEQIVLLGKENDLIEIETTIETNYKLDLEILEKTLEDNKDHNKLLLLNNPNNPTGLTYSNEDIKHISKILRKYNCSVLADEIYMNLTHYEKCNSISKYIPDLTIVGSSVSKDLGCGGYRLGWLVFPKEQRELFTICNSYCSSIYSCASVPIQYATSKMLQNQELFASHCEQSSLIYKYIANEICDILQSSKIRFSRPDSSWYIFLNLSEYKTGLLNKGIRTSYELSEFLINEIGFVGVPGESFNITGFNLRISLVDFKVSDIHHVIVEDIDLTTMKKGITTLVVLLDSL